MIIVNLFTSHNINLGVTKIKDFLHPNFCFAETILNNNIKSNKKMKPFPYERVCNHYEDNCNSKPNQEWWVFNSLEGLLKRQMFYSKINKHICREEHSHHNYEEMR